MKPSQGPHKLRESIPLNLLISSKIKLALNSKEAKIIVKAKEDNIFINWKVRKNTNSLISKVFWYIKKIINNSLEIYLNKIILYEIMDVFMHILMIEIFVDYFFLRILKQKNKTIS